MENLRPYKIQSIDIPMNAQSKSHRMFPSIDLCAECRRWHWLFTIRIKICLCAIANIYLFTLKLWMRSTHERAVYVRTDFILLFVILLSSLSSELHGIQ